MYYDDDYDYDYEDDYDDEDEDETVNAPAVRLIATESLVNCDYVAG